MYLSASNCALTVAILSNWRGCGVEYMFIITLHQVNVIIRDSQSPRKRGSFSSMYLISKVLRLLSRFVLASPTEVTASVTQESCGVVQPFFEI